MRENPSDVFVKHCGISVRKISTYSSFAIVWMTWRNNICDVNYSPSLFTFLQIINSMKHTWFFLCFIIKMLDKRIIYKKCIYSCLYHVSSVGKAVSLLASRSNTAFPTDLTWYKQLYIHNVYIMCIYLVQLFFSCKTLFIMILYCFQSKIKMCTILVERRQK